MADSATSKDEPGSNGMFKGVLVGHGILTLGTAIGLGIHYLNKDVGTAYSTLNLVSATASIIAVANFLLSALNGIVGVFMGDGTETRLKMVSLNNARNIMTGTSMVLAAVIYGMEDGTSIPWTIVTAFWCTAGVRLFDTMLDVGSFGEVVQCPDEVDRGDELQKRVKGFGKKFMVAIFASLSLGTALVLWFVYIGDTGIEFGSTNSDDDILLLVVFIALLLHLVLIVLTLLLQFKVIEGAFLSFLGKKDCGDEVKMHSLNEIPLVSAAVFTYNLMSLSLIAGERIEDGTQVNLLGAMIAIIGLAEIVGRRLI